MPAAEYVRAKTDLAIKNEAADLLATMGLTVFDSCKMMLTKIALEKRLPYRLPYTV